MQMMWLQSAFITGCGVMGLHDRVRVHLTTTADMSQCATITL